MNTNDFPKRLQILAKELKIEHQVFARAGGVSKATFSNYMHGQKFPRMETIANWVHTYGIDATWLITGHGSMFLESVHIQSHPSQSAMQNIQPTTADPLIIRMQTAVSLLKEANATDEVIQNAILTALQGKT